MTREKTRKLSDLIAAVQLEDVRLVEAAAEAAIRNPADAGSVRLSFRTDARFVERAGEFFFVRATMGASVARKAEPQSPLVTIRAVFELKYRLPPEIDARDEDLNEFANVNGVFNAWPYGREFIHSVSARMNLPPIVAPVFRLSDVVKRAPARSRAKSAKH
jgi:hypothetical protein